jgi:hypothetical protein
VSIYAVNLVARQVLKDPAFRDALSDDPAAALVPFDLRDNERAALLDGDITALYEMGAHEYLLMGLGRWGVLVLDMSTFAERIQRAQPRIGD